MGRTISFVAGCLVGGWVVQNFEVPPIGQFIQQGVDQIQKWFPPKNPPTSKD